MVDSCMDYAGLAGGYRLTDDFHYAAGVATLFDKGGCSMPTTRNTNLAVRVDPATRARLDQLATRCGRPLSHVLRAALANAEKAVPRAWFETGEIERAAGAGTRQAATG